MHLYIYIYIYIYTYIYTIPIYTIHIIYLYTCTYTCLCIHIHIHAHARSHVHAHIIIVIMHSLSCTICHIPIPNHIYSMHYAICRMPYIMYRMHLAIYTCRCMTGHFANIEMQQPTTPQPSRQPEDQPEELEHPSDESREVHVEASRGYRRQMLHGNYRCCKIIDRLQGSARVFVWACARIPVLVEHCLLPLDLSSALCLWRAIGISMSLPRKAIATYLWVSLVLLHLQGGQAPGPPTCEKNACKYVITQACKLAHT